MDFGSQIGNVLGSGLIGGLSYLGASSANQARLQEAQRNRDFQERMSSTSYQRAMEDMRKAGLNPILAYHQGGASTPSGSMAEQGDEIAPALSSALDYQRTRAEIQNLRAMNQKIHSETLLNHALKGSAESSAKHQETQVEDLLAQLPGKQFEGQMDSNWFGKSTRVLQRIMKLIPVLGLFV